MTAASAAASLIVPEAAPGTPSRPADAAVPDLRRGLSTDWTCARLEAIGAGELHLAASILGIFPVAVANHADGALPPYQLAELTERVRRTNPPTLGSAGHRPAGRP